MQATLLLLAPTANPFLQANAFTSSLNDPGVECAFPAGNNEAASSAVDSRNCLSVSECCGASMVGVGIDCGGGGC